MRVLGRRLVLVCAGVLGGIGAGCGDDAANPEQDADACASPCSGGEQDGFLADAGGGWLSLVQGDWEIPARTETYRCARATVTRDIYISDVRSLSPVGTHHTVVTVEAEPTEPDGITECDVGTNANQAIFGAGVGTNDYAFPEGVAIKLNAGQQVLANLHLFNADDEKLAGTSGTLVRVIEESDVEHVADAILSGAVDLEIPPGRVVQNGVCTMTHDVTLLAVLPHMHQLGVHMKAVAKSSVDGDVMLHDADYTFDSQVLYPIEEVQMRAGDQVEVECTYDNTTDGTVVWGDSSLEEMCFMGLLRYPAGDSTSYFVCSS